VEMLGGVGENLSKRKERVLESLVERDSEMSCFVIG